MADYEGQPNEKERTGIGCLNQPILHDKAQSEQTGSHGSHDSPMQGVPLRYWRPDGSYRK